MKHLSGSHQKERFSTVFLGLAASLIVLVIFFLAPNRVFSEDGSGGVYEGSPDKVSETSPYEPGRDSVRVDKTLSRKSRLQTNAIEPDIDNLSSTGDSASVSNSVRRVPAKPLRTVITPHVDATKVIVKFVEGSLIRQRNNRLVSLGNADLARLNGFLASFPKGKWQRLFKRSEEDLEADKRRGEKRSRRQLADLNLYYLLELTPQMGDPADIIDALNGLDIVEIAYPPPIPEEAQILEEPGPVSDVLPTTPDLTAQQGYLNAAPAGIDANYSWTFDGGAGSGIDFIDIEQGWDVCHEDLNVFSSDVLNGTNTSSDHGTSVLGVVIGYDNDYGVTGIANDSNARMISYVDNGSYPDIADALNQAATTLAAGDIILVEVHAYAEDSSLVCPCNCTQFEYVAMEYWQANFDAIQTATANGIIVVEAAGNGSMDLDSAIYNSRFQRTFRDSGAILVGAATSTDPRQPKCWTNYGSRIDVCAWGENVTTTGYSIYGSLFGTGTDDCQDYRDDFSGTSSASPIIVGAAANIQGILQAKGDALLTPEEMRAVLSGNGTEHGDPEGPFDSQPLGVMPDLRQAIPAALGLNGKILVFNPRSSETDRMSALGYKVTTTNNVADLVRTNLQNYDVLWITVSTDPATYSAYNSNITSWVYYDGGGLIIEQPNTVGDVSVFPYGYEVNVNSIYYSPGYNSIITNGQHPITSGLADSDLSGDFDTVFDDDIGYKWWVLARNADVSTRVSLLASYYGTGRFVYHNGVIGTSSGAGSDAYVSQMLNWAINSGPRIALVEVGSSIDNSVIRALNDLGRKFDFYNTDDLTTIDFTSYDAVILAMNGGNPSDTSILNAKNFADSGGNLIILGGSSYVTFANAVETHLLNIDLSDYSWDTVTSNPHLEVTNSNHPLTDELPDTYDFITSTATYYMIRSEDPLARVMAINGDGYDALLQKPIGSGTLNWFINVPGTSYWNDAGDYNILKTVIRNMLAQGVERIYHSPGSTPYGLAYRSWYHLYNTDSDDSIYDIQHYSGALYDTFSSPGGGLSTGLAYDSDRNSLWNADYSTDTIYRLNYIDMSIADSFPSPRSDPADIAYGGGYLWASILQSGPIIKIDPETGAEVGTVTVPTGSRPFGLTWADGYLYVTDTNNDNIYKIHPTTSNVVSTFPSPGSYPSGMAFDGDYFWVSDLIDDSIYKLALQSEAADVWISSIIFDPPAPEAGEGVNVSITVQNSGDVATPGFYIEFYKDIDHMPYVYQYSSDWWSENLAAGGSITVSEIIVYSDIGTFQAGAFADSGNSVDEGVYGDNNGLWPVSLTVNDTISPTGSIIINAGDTYTNSTSVTLTLSATDSGSGVTQMCFGNYGDSWSAWEPYGTTKSWTIEAGKAVYVMFQDAAGNISAQYNDTIILDQTPPTGSIIINAGDTYTNSTSVTLTLSATDSGSGVTQMCFGNYGDSWSAWEPYATTKSWTIEAGKAVYVMFQDAAGNISAQYDDIIILDQTLPTGSIIINGGATHTATTSVTLTLSATDTGSGMANMRFGNYLDPWSAWEPYATTKSWTIEAGKAVYVQFQDAAGNVSLQYSDSIILDQSPPIPDPMAWTTEPYETSTSSISMLARTAIDKAPPVQYYFDFTTSPTGGLNGTDSGWQSSTSYTDTALGTNHQYGYRVYARDGVFNQTAPSTPISYDFTGIEAPTGITFGVITTTSIQARSTNTPSGLTRGVSGLYVSNHTTSTNSGWKQNNDFWTSTALTPNSHYDFRALARNGDGTNTSWSILYARYTLANTPGSAPFSNITETSMQANWTANGNPVGTQYYCENTTTATNSGWTTSTSWISSGLSCGMPYSFRIKARNGNGVETAWISLGSQATLICPNICECDLNADGSCNMADWPIFGQDWGRTDCLDVGVNCECDLNNDGTCDMADWAIFGQDWGRTDCPTP